MSRLGVFGASLIEPQMFGTHKPAIDFPSKLRQGASVSSGGGQQLVSGVDVLLEVLQALLGIIFYVYIFVTLETFQGGLDFGLGGLVKVRKKLGVGLGNIEADVGYRVVLQVGKHR